MLKVELNSAERQEVFGAALAARVPKAFVIWLEGGLGAGKTTLVRGFLRGLGHRGPVRSPTYTLMEPYELAERTCYHFDLYRLADPGELEYLGVRDLLAEEVVLLVEWPERGEGELPPPDLRVRIEHRPESRMLELQPQSPAGARLVAELEPEIRKIYQ